MPEPEGTQATAPAPQKAATRIVAWLASGVLSGAVTACLVTTVDWIFLEGTPIPIGPDSSGEAYHFLKLTPIQHCLFLARFLVHDALEGAFLGLLGGVVTALITSLTWKGSGGLKGAALLSGIFGILFAGWNLLASVVLDFREVAAFGAIGAVFGANLVLFARLSSMLFEAGKKGRQEGRAVLRAWLRLLIYLPSALVLFLLGIVIASDLAAAYLTPGPDGEAAARTPATLTFAIYGEFSLIVLFTLWFARRYDCRSWREIGLTVTPRTLRDLLLGSVLGATGFVLVGGYAVLGLVSIHRTENSVSEVFRYGLLFCPAVGFSEELIFRGYLLPNLVQVVGRAGAIWLSAILFWAIHLIGPDAGEPIDAIALVMFGVLCALCYLATGSLWLPISLHSTWDFTSLGVFRGPPRLPLPSIFSVEFHAPAWLVGQSGRAGLGALAFLLLLLGIVWGWLYRPAMLAEQRIEVGTRLRQGGEG
jgi:membrane protease YdiL (CAAX protease family)